MVVSKQVGARVDCPALTGTSETRPTGQISLQQQSHLGVHIYILGHLGIPLISLYVGFFPWTSLTVCSGHVERSLLIKLILPGNLFTSDLSQVCSSTSS